MNIKNFRGSLLCVAATMTAIVITSLAIADPCGMVPPIYDGNSSPITRIGLQKTYVFYNDGVETFVIRPGFEGNVDNFGMLIPFPNPPELRKVADNVFEHIANAVDPPEVVVDLRMELMRCRDAMPMAATAMEADGAMAFRDEVQVLKQEAVGMYEVAVLAAGSSESLKKWMDENGYQYPEGMDEVTNDYIEADWCFVAVKTKVGQKGEIEPQPGQRELNAQLPDGSVFDGHVQGMGFRFKSEELVVPMRLSAFNEGDLRNVVYILADGPRKIRAIPEEYVMRQVSGAQLIKNVTDPLPLRIIGGTEQDIPEYRREGLVEERNPGPKNGLAKELFASDLLAVSSGNLSLEHEETEKELLKIGERLGLRGEDVDRENAMALQTQRDDTVNSGLAMLEEMTLTVVDGDFPRQVIARDNLEFAQYDMPAERNTQLNYDPKMFAPGQAKEGILQLGAIDWDEIDRQIAASHTRWRFGFGSLICLGLLGMIGTFVVGRGNTTRRAACVIVAVTCLAATSAMAAGQDVTAADAEMIQNNLNALRGEAPVRAVESLAEICESTDSWRDHAVGQLVFMAGNDATIKDRGWAIIALTEIGGQDVDEHLLGIHADEKQEMIVRTWCAAARVAMTRTTPGLIEKANLITQFPALGRPIGMRLVEKLGADGDSAKPEEIIAVTTRVPQLQQALIPTIMALGPEKLSGVMFHAPDNESRRMAAGYLGTLAQRDQNDLVTEIVTSQLQFDKDANDVPWAGTDESNSALFLPGINWGQPDSQALVGNLIRWYVWCDVNDKQPQLQQIHNNIRSVNLARAAGYNSPGWNDISAEQWLMAWGEAMGKDEVKEILEEQNLMDEQKYADVLKNL